MELRLMHWVDTYFHPHTLGIEDKTGDAVDAVRLLVVLILGELFASLALGKKVYSLRQSMSNVAASLLMHVFFATCLKGINMIPYFWVHSHHRLLEWDDRHNLWMHALCFLCCDLGHYVMHRAMHASNLLYSAHVTHHQSVDYNFSVGIRLSMWESTMAWVLYLPLALICPPSIFLTHRTASVGLQVLTHTELVYKLWWPLELILVTPSHHRVHHARNYGMKNHGGLLIIWDRLFGTFQEELQDRRPIYGLNEQEVPQGTYNPLWHQLHHFFATLRLATSGKVPLSKALWTRTTGPGMIYNYSPTAGADTAYAGTGKQAAAGHKVNLSASAAGPGDGVAAATPPAAKPRGTPKRGDAYHPWDKRPRTALDVYAALQLFLVHVPSTLVFMKHMTMLSILQILVGFVFSVWGTTTLAWLCGGQRRAVLLEMLRLVVIGWCANYTLQQGMLPPEAACWARGATLLSVASLLFLLPRLQDLNHVAALNKTKAA